MVELLTCQRSGRLFMQTSVWVGANFASEGYVTYCDHTTTQAGCLPTAEAYGVLFAECMLSRSVFTLQTVNMYSKHIL